MQKPTLIDRDLKHIWHPCSQMKDYETFKPLEVESASGSYIALHNGKKIIDAVSSWWCKSLGHNHPRLKAALLKQADQFEHVILANTTNKTIVALSEKLTQLTPNLNKVCYAGDGSSAVEIAMKMSVHTRIIRGESQKVKFIALQNAYHGETVGALSVSDLGIYKSPYQSLLFDASFISSIPYVSSVNDPLWQDCSTPWNNIEKQLSPLAETATAVIIEPILQGAGGMLFYSRDFLRRLRAWTQKNNIHLIADEILTGLGRTGKMLACEHAEIEPDFLCLAKGLTGGWLPFSAMLTRDNIYQLFYDDFKNGKSFLHSHTHSGNVLGASVALEVLNIMEEENICQQAEHLGTRMREAMQSIMNDTGRLTNLRQIGAVVAADIIGDPEQRLGFQVYQRAVALGALLRPLGNTIYWLPPLNMHFETLEKLKSITQQSLKELTS